jgi:hypothetical protein
MFCFQVTFQGKSSTLHISSRLIRNSAKRILSFEPGERVSEQVVYRIAYHTMQVLGGSL